MELGGPQVGEVARLGRVTIGPFTRGKIRRVLHKMRLK